MNLLSIDFGTKHIGLAISIKNIISPLKTIPNDKTTIEEIRSVCDEYQIEKIIMGLSSGKTAKLTLEFTTHLKKMLKLPVETVDETLSTKESWSTLKTKSLKKWKEKKDSLSAAHILKRVVL